MWRGHRPARSRTGRVRSRRRHVRDVYVNQHLCPALSLAIITYEASQASAHHTSLSKTNQQSTKKPTPRKEHLQLTLVRSHLMRGVRHRLHIRARHIPRWTSRRRNLHHRLHRRLPRILIRVRIHRHIRAPRMVVLVRTRHRRRLLLHWLWRGMLRVLWLRRLLLLLRRLRLWLGLLLGLRLRLWGGRLVWLRCGGWCGEEHHEFATCVRPVRGCKIEKDQVESRRNVKSCKRSRNADTSHIRQINHLIM